MTPVVSEYGPEAGACEQCDQFWGFQAKIFLTL